MYCVMITVKSSSLETKHMSDVYDNYYEALAEAEAALKSKDRHSWKNFCAEMGWNI